MGMKKEKEKETNKERIKNLNQLERRRGSRRNKQNVYDGTEIGAKRKN